MNIANSKTSNPPAPGALRPIIYFTASLMKANLRSIKALALTLGMPVFMLFSVWVPSMAGDDESREIMQLLFPAIILLSVIMPGLTQATRLASWREQKIFQRFALTPVPLAHLQLGMAFTQIVIGLVQGMFMLLFGVFIVGLDMAWENVVLVLGIMILAGGTFIAFGSLIASFISKSDLAGYVFFFTIMPLTFLASFPSEMMPDSLNEITPWLPTSMAIELIGPLFLNNQLTDRALLVGMGLVIYSILFVSISASKLRPKA